MLIYLVIILEICKKLQKLRQSFLYEFYILYTLGSGGGVRGKITSPQHHHRCLRQVRIMLGT